jgi:hypothetical protein
MNRLNGQSRRRRSLRTVLMQSVAVAIIAGLLLPCAAGCGIFGAVGSKLSKTMVKPAYNGLAGQSIAVMVAASPGTQQEYRRIQLDISERLVNTLQITQKNGVDELKGTTFPAKAAPNAIFAFQRNFPKHEWEPITTLAPKFGVTRLIHIEIDSFTLHPDNVPELFRGELSARVQVVEVTGNVGKVAYEESLTASFPPGSNTMGTPNLTTQTTYLGTVSAFASAVVQRFVTHEQQTEVAQMR